MSRKIKWQKLGGGTLRLASGEIIKPNQIFEATPEEIPKAFRDIVVPLDPLPQEPPLEVTPGGYQLRHLKGLWKKICEHRVWNAIKKIWHDPVWSQVIVWGIIGLLIIAGAYISNIWKLIPGLKVSEHNNIEITKKNTPLNIITEGKLPYLENVTILDNTIYIKHYYRSFVIGGKNLRKLKITARTYEGASAKFELKEFPPEIRLEISDKPYIEFEYKNNYYSIEVTKPNWVYHYKLQSISNLTMELESLPLNK